VNKDIKKPTAKEASHRIRKLSTELAFGGKSEKNLVYAWILLLILSVILTFIIQDWGAGIKPPGVQANVGVSVTRLDSSRLEVMIISLEKDMDIEYLTYYTSRGSGYINKSANLLTPVREIGDIGIIPGSDSNEMVEIFATMRNGTIKIYSKTE
jgi:hypothetical protein